MGKDNVVTLDNLEAFRHDLLTEVLRPGAQQLLAGAVKAEVDEFYPLIKQRIVPRIINPASCAMAIYRNVLFKQALVKWLS